MLRMDALPARVRMFVLGCALTDGTEGLKTYYGSLPVEGWFVELARTHGRALLGAWTHDTFGAWLGLRDDETGRAYRAMLKRADIDRDELIQVARRVLKCETTDGVRALQRSTEMVRFRRMREAVERRTSSMGRPTVAADTTGQMGKQLEKWRMALRVSVDDWCEGLGLSSPTYRTRLAKEKGQDAEKVRSKLEQLVKDGKDLYHKLSTPIVARYPVVDKEELADAYSVVANDIEQLRATLLREELHDATPLNPVDQMKADVDGTEISNDEFLPLDLYSWMRPAMEELP